MPSTLKYGITYPAGSVAPNVPVVMQAQAQSVEAALATLDTETAAAVTTTDINWAYFGGLFITTSATGKTRVNLNLRMTRIGGGAVALSTTPVQAMNLIPLAYRPAGYSVTQYTVLQDANGADVWGMYVRVAKDGTLFLATNSGTANIAVGYQVILNMSWLLP